MDLNRAYQEAKSLPDEALSQELASPSGFLPGYIIMSELEDRKALRAGGGGQRPPGSMKDELLSSMGGFRQYANGGIVAQLNPGYAQMMGTRNRQFANGLREEDIIDANGGIAPLMSLQAPGAPAPAPSNNSMMATTPGTPEELKRLGGIGSLIGR